MYLCFFAFCLLRAYLSWACGQYIQRLCRAGSGIKLHWQIRKVTPVNGGGAPFYWQARVAIPTVGELRGDELYCDGKIRKDPKSARQDAAFQVRKARKREEKSWIHGCATDDSSNEEERIFHELCAVGECYQSLRSSH